MKPNRFIGVLLTKLVIVLSMSQFCNCCLADPPATWNLVFSNSPVQITSMAYGNGTFVGVGGGLRFISHDGSNWTIYASSPVINQGGVAYGNGMFLSFGTNNQNKANYVLQSTNGITWTTVYTSSNALFAAAYGNNTWVFLANNEIVTAKTATPNWTWSEFQPSFTPACITYANGGFVIGAYLGSFYSILSSPDGITWQYNCNLPYTSSPYRNNRIAYGNGVFVATSYNSTLPQFFVSSNLVQWSSATFPFDIISGSSNAPVAFGGNEFVTYLYSQIPPALPFQHVTYTSSDGNTWISNSIIGLINSFTYGQGTFVAVAPPNILQSGVFATDSNSPATTLGISTYPGVTINGTAGAVYQIQYTTNLNSMWQPLTNFMLPFSPYIWIDTSSPAVGQKFYRSVQLQ